MINRWHMRKSLLAAIPVWALLAVPVVGVIGSPPAHAQSAETTLEFREALEPFGEWVSHRRWGEVWVPSSLPRDWRPYTEGRWVYTDEWGWYWVSDEPFGWIVYHYGRWVFDDSVGWLWLPNEEWGPAWVTWRRGGGYAGWAPLPPDEIVEEIYEAPNPSMWTFVPVAAMTAPRIRPVMLPRPRVAQFFRQTVVVNRTYVVRERGPVFAVNPGIPPAYIAAAARRPIRAVEIRPQVLAGTRGVSGATEVRSQEVREYWRERRSRPDARPGRGPTEDRFRPALRETTTTIAPARSVPPPQRLERSDPGRLGDRPPRAAQSGPGGAAPSASAPPGASSPMQPPPGQAGPGQAGTAPAGDSRPRRPGAIMPGDAPPAGQRGPQQGRPGAITPSAQPPGQVMPAQPGLPTGTPGAGAPPAGGPPAVQAPRQPVGAGQPPGPVRRFEDRRPPPPRTTVPAAPAPSPAPTTSPPPTSPPPAAIQRPTQPPPPAAPPPAAIQRPMTPSAPPPAVQRPAPPPAVVQPAPTLAPSQQAAPQRSAAPPAGAQRPPAQQPRPARERPRRPGEPDPSQTPR